MHFRLTAVLAGLALAACVARPTVERAESIYADLVDAQGIVGAIDSGLFASYRGKDQGDWEAEVRMHREQLAATLARIPQTRETGTDARVLGILKSKLDASNEEAGDDTSPHLRCADSKRKDLKRTELSAALSACFTEIANNIEFEGERLDRVTALGRLQTTNEPERRKALFLSFQPLWQAINADNGSDSPYRRLIALTKADTHGNTTPIDAAARTLGVNASQVESWLVQILETWSTATAGQITEPWDYRYAAGAADRALSAQIPLASLLPLNHRYYRDLGADLDALGVLYDLAPRPEKSSVAYTDVLIHGRWTDGHWQPTVARVLAPYRDGSLGSLNELIHESGHAVHISAIRNRPAFVDWNDDLFVEAFADVSSWSVYEPAWQRRYLSTAASEAASLRALFSSVMLDVAWALFEVRMLHEPASDPNALWTEITQRYLHIAPHPELSWWAVRGQLVDSPGYMVNYGLGAVLTADIRARVRAQIGDFDTGNARWYPWLSETLLRYASQRDTPALLTEFIGRPVSPDALLTQLKRVGGVSTPRTARLDSSTASARPLPPKQ
jgi:hypothetical protein